MTDAFFPLKRSADMKKIDIILIGGQSNAVGLTEITTLDEQYRHGSYDHVYLYQEGNFRAEDKGRLLQGIHLGMGCKPHLMGIEYGIAAELDALGGSYGLIRFAYGGTDLTFHWQTEFPEIPDTVEKKGYCFYSFVNTVRRGLAAYRAAGFDPVIRGMVWHQGESDSNKTIIEAQQYEENLRTLFAAIRKELALPDLKYIVGSISSNPPLAEFADIVREGQRHFCETDAHSVYMDNTDLPVGPDGWHYSGNEDWTLGRRFGAYIKEFLLA